MTAAEGDDISETQFLEFVDTIVRAEPSLTPIGAALITAHHFGIAKDSRTFSRKFGIEHALVLREITGLSGHGGLLKVVSRNNRTQRTELALAPGGERIVSRAFA